MCVCVSATSRFMLKKKSYLCGATWSIFFKRWYSHTHGEWTSI